MGKRAWNDPPEWQRDYFGRHVKLVPAENAYGYQYRPWEPPYQPFGNPEQIIRAVPAEGMVTDQSPHSVPVPQVDLRMGRPHKWKRAVTRIRRKRPQRKDTDDIIA